METQGNSYRNSQDHLIIALNEQIQVLMPLKESYMGLQKYHIKIVNDLQGLLQDHNYSSAHYQKQIKELALINEELDFKKTELIEELRLLENQSAKLVLQKKNLLSASETSNSKFNFENQQSIALQCRARDLLEEIKKVEQNMSFNEKLTGDIEREIRLKEDENKELMNEIKRRKESKTNLNIRSNEMETKIKKIGGRNDETMNEIRELQKKINITEIEIREQFQKNKKTTEIYLQQRQRLSNLHNQKQYYCRLIESQLLTKEDLGTTEEKLQTLIDRRVKELRKIQEDNQSYKEDLENHQKSKERGIQQKQKLAEHLAELIKTNTMLLENMEKCCSEDRRVHNILQNKFAKLDGSWKRMKATMNQSTNEQKKRRAFEQIYGNIKEFPDTKESWAKYSSKISQSDY